VRVEYSPANDQAYIHLREIEAGGVATTVPGWPGTAAFGINLDFDHDGRLVGIDIDGGASERLPREVLAIAKRR
jgi:uncharacterized protein YuzE